MTFKEWWEKHIEEIDGLRRGPTLDWIKPAFQLCWDCATLSQPKPSDNQEIQPIEDHG